MRKPPLETPKRWNAMRITLPQGGKHTTGKTGSHRRKSRAKRIAALSEYQQKEKQGRIVEKSQSLDFSTMYFYVLAIA